MAFFATFAELEPAPSIYGWQYVKSGITTDTNINPCYSPYGE